MKRIRLWNNRVGRRVNKSVYAQLILLLMMSLVIALGVFVACFLLFKSCNLFKQTHVSYEQDRFKVSEKISSVVREIYAYDTVKDEIDYAKRAVEEMAGEAYLIDTDGDVIASSKEGDIVTTLKIDLNAWNTLYKNRAQDGQSSLCYPLVINQNVYYLLQNVDLEPEYKYTNEWRLLGAGIVAIIVYFILVFLGIRKKIHYIQYLGDSVDQISKGDLTYKLTLRGEDELTRIAKNINEMEASLLEKIELERTENAQQNELITNLSHDFKTPLTIILGYLDLLRSQSVLLEADRAMYIETAYEKTITLRNMVLRLFELVTSRQTKDALNKVEVNFTRLMKQSVIEYDLMAKEMGHKIVTSLPEERVMIYADLNKMTSMLTNLMGNAIKYTTAGNDIYVSLKTEEKSILLSISNPCERMEEEDVEQLFDKFFRGDKARNSAVEGNGVGLSIVKNIVEAHDGKIWADYEEEQLTIRVRLRR